MSEKRLNEPLAADAALDTTGLFCPIPVVKTAEKVKALPAGAVLEVISDDGGIQVDLPDWCAAFGHEFLGYLREGAAWRLYLRKKGARG